jgi:hypothetical protein
MNHDPVLLIEPAGPLGTADAGGPRTREAQWL